MATNKAEQIKTRSELGTYFRDFGDDLKLEGAARVQIGDDVLSLNPPGEIEFGVEIEEEDEEGEEEKQRLTFELLWEKTEYDEDVSE